MEALKERVTELELMVNSLTEAVDLLMKERPKEETPAPISAAGIAIGEPYKPSAPKPNSYRCQVCLTLTSDPDAYADQIVYMDHLKHSLMQRHYCCAGSECLRFFYNHWGEQVKLL